MAMRVRCPRSAPRLYLQNRSRNTERGAERGTDRHVPTERKITVRVARPFLDFSEGGLGTRLLQSIFARFPAPHQLQTTEIRLVRAIYGIRNTATFRYTYFVAGVLHFLSRVFSHLLLGRVACPCNYYDLTPSRSESHGSHTLHLCYSASPKNAADQPGLLDFKCPLC